MSETISWDIETMANKAYVWGKYEQDVIAYIQQGYMLSWSVKILGGKQITKALSDYPGYKKNPTDDRALVTELHDLISKADIAIAHNGDRFDVRKMNTRFIALGLNPPEPYKTIDTLKIARRHFAFNSNKLDDLGDFLGVGRKQKHPGFDLWLGCEKGDPASWQLMKKYNKQDVILLENIYLKLLPWITNHPNPTDNGQCTNCKHFSLKKEGTRQQKNGLFQSYQCKDCGSWKQVKIKERK